MSDFYFDLVKGTTVTLRATIVRDGAPVPLTGATSTLTLVLAVPDAAAPVQEIVKIIGDGITVEGDEADGVLVAIIDPEDTDPITTKTTYRCRWHLQEASGIKTNIGKGDIAFAP